MTNESKIDQEPLEPSNSEPDSSPKRRKRTGRKRSVFHKTPRPAWPVRGLWESAPQEAREAAHKTCMLMLEYWLGKQDKTAVAKELGVSPLRVWQLSQLALSGMLAGLLPQPRRRVKPSVFEPKGTESPVSMSRRIMELEKELARTEDLVRVLRTAPWSQGATRAPKKGGQSRGAKKKRAAKQTQATVRAAARRPVPPPAPEDEGGAGGGG